MIIPPSEKNESERHSTRNPNSQTTVDAPPSPPPYSATVASSDDEYQGPAGGSRASSGLMPNLNASPAPRQSLPPRCNHLVERRSNSSVSGTWHVDTALQIPEGLLPSVIEFDGVWNQDIQKARKDREKEMRKRESIWRSAPNTPPPPPIIEVRPNLMLATSNGSVSGQIHIVSSDGVIRPTVIIAQCNNGSVNLKIHAAPDQPVRVFANSTNGSVNVKIPPTFAGAVVMSTTWGNNKISDPIKEKLTTFSSTSNTTRCFIGDWQAQGFGATDSNDDPPLPSFQSTPPDPFAAWTGPLIHISSTNASVSLSFTDEGILSGSGSTGFWGFMSGLFGAGGDQSAPPQPPQPPQPLRPSQPPQQPQPPLLLTPPSDNRSRDKKLPLIPDLPNLD